MKPTSMMGPFERTWRIIYPILLYLVITAVVSFFWMFAIELEMMLKDGAIDFIAAEERYMQDYLKISCLSNLFIALGAGFFYWRDKKRFKPVAVEKNPKWYLLILVMGAALCMALNGLMNLLGLFEAFAEDYESMAGNLYNGPIVLEAVTLILLAPLAEELIFRGLIFKRMRTYMTYLPAAITSSLMFAFFHGNILQGVYSFFLAFMMTYLYEHFRTLGSVVLFHGAANAISVLVTESAVVSRWLSNETVYYGVMSVSIVATLAGLYYMMEYFRKKEEVS